jgi:hypothetical protein
MQTLNVFDAALIQYVISFVISLYGAGLFTWWWIRSGKASFVFMCVTFLFAGKAVESIVYTYARVLRLCGDITFIDSSWIWAYKGIFSIIASAMVIGYLTLRAIGLIHIPLHIRRKGDKTTACLCRTGNGVIVHQMGGPIIYYKCQRCGEEWQKGDEGYEKAKKNGEKIIFPV